MPKADARSMSADDLFALLRRIMVREFDLAEERIELDSDFEALDLDSIDAVDLAVSVEEEVGFQFATEDLAQLVTLRDVVELIRGERSR